MMWVVEVPVATYKDTAAICIACMVAHGAHLHSLTCLEDVVTVHSTTNFDSMQFAVLECMHCFEGLGSFHTVSVTITIPVPTNPLVRVSSVHHPPCVVASSVEVSTFDFCNRNLVPA